ncbi:N-acylneuraminate-9-phosphate synthase [Rhizobium sp. S9]|uniref:N-acetylneuraminate synthase family protein n=1 Tax=unclassified Rhizobium TaxID=2613769 RepID=UPI000A20FA57|nr:MULTISPECIES: N-acetylneuraminate synthase family protein [unclassified Rhizobium]ARO22099.1 N-acetylneuraminic acid synthase NeuB family protein [Rhizobium sp. TAL182]PDS95799.1 N-acylneuraminate-9-phosphate synthase [Rhizobium sp. S9]
MATVTLRNGRLIGDYLAPYLIAELNTSHFGEMATARTMIAQAKEAGCDCVKFQSWSTESLYSAGYYRENAIAKRIVNKFSLADAKLEELAAYCREIGIDFASTPYSRYEAEFLVKVCEVPFIKIASMELNNLPYLRRLGSLGAPLVLSTGMGSLEEIIRAVEAIEETGNRQIIILHCTSVYPAPPETIRLQNILGLRSEFPAYPIGYSDHSTGIEIPAASIALGACVIEKHFTLDSSRIGMDNQMATEPEEMKAMISACHKVHTALGGTGRILDPSERDQIAKMRRSIITARALKAGSVIGADDLDAKRPGTGIAPTEIGIVVGKRLKVDIDADEIILPEHFE